MNNVTTRTETLYQVSYTLNQINTKELAIEK